ncbi:MAG: glycosyltransferase [bacterium]
MKKLLICSHAYVSPENLIKPQLLAKKFKVGLVVPKKWEAMGRKLQITNDELRMTNFKTFRLGTFLSGNGGKYFYNPFSLFLVFLKFKPEILYVEEEPWTPSAFELLFLAKLFRVKRKVIFSWENLDLPLAGWQRFVKKFVLTGVDLVVCGNSEAKKLIENYLGWKSWRHRKTCVFVNAQFGVDTKRFVSSSVITHPSPDKFVIGFVGRFVSAKGIDTLIEALSLLPKDCRLLLVSTTKLPDRFLDLAKRHKVLNRIQVVESKPHQELPQYLNQMDVFVLPSKTTPSWKEQFGRVLIEAMACGLPVIGSSSGAIPEVVGSAGLTFEENNPSDLAKKIKKLKDLPKLCQELSQKALKKATTFYTHKAVVDRLTSIL